MPQAGATALLQPLPVPGQQRSGASNGVQPSQTVNDGIKDGIDTATHRPKSSHSSRSGLPYTATLSVPANSSASFCNGSDRSGPSVEEDSSEVGAFYWTVLAPGIVNSGREEQGSVSL